MNEQEKESLDELLRYHSGVIGSARLTVLGLKALISAVNQVQAYPDELKELFDEVLDAVRGTRPKLIALIDLLTEFEEEFHPYLESDDMEEARAQAAWILAQKVSKYEEKRSAVGVP